MEQQITIEFKNCIDLAEILNKYNHNDSEYVTMQTGYDGNIYILLNKNIPERIDGMFVPAESNSRFAVLVLQIDWHEEKIIQEKYYDLGVQKMNYSFIQPTTRGFLLVAARCRYNKGNPDNNAAVIDPEGNLIKEFCIGDGISHCLDREYVPEIKGAESFIISEDEAALVIDKGYDAHDEFAVKKILYDKLGDEIPVLFKYKGIECRVGLISSYGSKAVFMENWKHMFIRSFQSLCTDWLIAALRMKE